MGIHIEEEPEVVREVNIEVSVIMQIPDEDLPSNWDEMDKEKQNAWAWKWQEKAIPIPDDADIDGVSCWTDHVESF
jgi:trehalose/maltose hydrolase-like predicted phosphorylase